MMAASAFAVLPVKAYTYHGYTTSWDRGDYYYEGYYAYSWYDTTYGLLGADTHGLYDYAWAYMNSGEVTAVADVDHVTVTLWWTYGSKYKTGWSILKFDVKLYVNGYYRGIESADFLTWDDGYQQFTFNNEIIETGDNLDIDVIFEASAEGYQAEIETNFSYIGFATF